MKERAPQGRARDTPALAVQLVTRVQPRTARAAGKQTFYSVPARRFGRTERRRHRAAEQRRQQLQQQVYGRTVRRAIEDVMENGGRMQLAGELVHLEWDEATPEQKRYLIEREAGNAKSRVTRELREAVYAPVR